MPKTDQVQEEEFDPEVQEGFEDGDYGFIISSDGELKHMYLPEDFILNPPPEVKKILKIFGIKDLNLSVDGDILH